MNHLSFVKLGAPGALMLVVGCAGNLAGSPASSIAVTPHLRIPKPAICTPKVWASSLGTNAVYGYTAPSSTPCVTLTGPYNGLSLSAPITVSIGSAPKWLYVADLGNNRIVVFTYQGVFVKALSTTLGTQMYQPWGVCVSSKGIVGVANRQFNNTGPPGNVEFFLPTAPNNSTPTGYATSVLQGDQFCAFDRKGNFFVDGTDVAGGQKIAYLAAAFVPMPAQTLVDSGLGSASFWVGMYSRIGGSTSDTLSVGTSVGSSATQTVMNWKVSGPLAGPLAFTPLPSSTFTSYPVTTDAVYQLAPTRGGSTGSLYFADYGDGAVLSGPIIGGPVSTYNAVSGTVGVATRPTGQY
jgi:hypothetical protein